MAFDVHAMCGQLSHRRNAKMSAQFASFWSVVLGTFEKRGPPPKSDAWLHQIKHQDNQEQECLYMACHLSLSTISSIEDMDRS